MYKLNQIIILFFVLLTTSCTEFLQSFDEEKINVAVAQKNENIIKILNDDASEDILKRLRFNSEIVPIIDFDYITHEILGAKYNYIPVDKLRIITNLLRQIISYDIWQRVSQYNGQKINLSKIVFYGRELSSLEINYKQNEKSTSSAKLKLIKKSGTWMVYDLFLDNASLLEGYKKEYRNVLKRKSIKGLIKHLEKRTRKNK